MLLELAKMMFPTNALEYPTLQVQRGQSRQRPMLYSKSANNQRQIIEIYVCINVRLLPFIAIGGR